MARKQRRFTWMKSPPLKGGQLKIAHAQVVVLNIKLKKKASELFSKLTFYVTFLNIIVEEEATFERLEDDIQTFKRGEEGGCS